MDIVYVCYLMVRVRVIKKRYNSSYLNSDRVCDMDMAYVVTQGFKRE